MPTQTANITIEVLETPGLGDRSYVAADGDVAVVVDPQRDVDRVLEVVERLGARVTHVLETHVHNDYVTGGLELAQRTGADYVLPAGSDVEFDHVALGDGESLTTGSMRLRAVHTPGHTHHHVSWVVESADGGEVRGVFTGGSMLYGATGRTDLVSADDTVGLTHDQFRSVRRLAAELPGDAEVFPTHGFGSFCSATPTSGTSSTIADQARTNPALTLSEQEYVDTLLAGLTAYPAYYARMAPVNRRGPAPVDLSLPAPVEPAELRRRLEAGEWVVDLRERRAFAAGHLAGSLAFELSTNFVTYLGWLYSVGEPLTLVGESEEQVAEARRELVRIGVDDLAGIAVGDPATLADGVAVRSYGVTDFAGLADRMAQGPVHVLDARRDDERAAGGVRGSQHLPLHELLDRVEDVAGGPDDEVWVYCGSGYRSSIAASVLDRAGRKVVLVDDSFGTAAELGLVTTDEPAAG